MGRDTGLGRAVDAAGHAIFITDTDGTITDVNSVFEEVTGFSREEALGETPAILNAGYHDEEYFAHLWETILGGDVWESRIRNRRKDGELYEAQQTISPVTENGEPVEFVTVQLELPEKGAKRGTDKRYAELLHETADPMYVLDQQRTIQQVNDAMVEYTGYKRAALVGRPIEELLPSRSYHRRLREFAELERPGAHHGETLEATLVTKTGREIVTEANVTTVTDDRGAYRGSVGTLRDIHDRTQREQRLELLKQILTRVFRHNARNSLSVIQSSTELLATVVDEPHREHTERILERTQQLLDHSEKANLMEEVIDTDERYEIELTETVERVVRCHSDAHPEATITADIPTDATVSAHPRLETAISELLENAIEHAAADPKVQIWTEESDEFLILFIEDESGGLADHEIDVLVRGAESDLEHGSGVGLWLVRWIVGYSGAELISYRTESGSLMGIKFQSGESTAPSETASDAQLKTRSPESKPFAPAPSHIHKQEDSTTGDLWNTAEMTVVSREAELDRLEAIYETVTTSGPQTVLVTGEPGIGKTTVIRAFRDRLERRQAPPVIVSGDCQTGSTTPYHAVREVFSDFSDTAEFEELLANLPELDPDDPDSFNRNRHTLFRKIGEYLETVAGEAPLVIFIEDLQWASHGTLELLEYLSGRPERSVPILIVGTCRSDAIEEPRIARLISGETDGGEPTVELAPFDAGAVETALIELLDSEEIPAAFVEAFVDHTGGHPLFVAELADHFRRQPETRSGVAPLPEDFGDVPVPDSVETVVFERLEALSLSANSLLSLGAFIGSIVPVAVLHAASDRPKADVRRAIDELVRKRLWQREGETVRFVHGVVREIAQSRVSEERRRTFHGRIARVLEEADDRQPTENVSQIATHYGESGQFELAIEFYRKAGDQAATAYAYGDAREYYQRALKLTNEHDTLEQEGSGIYNALAETFLSTGAFDRAREASEAVLERSSGHSYELCRAQGILADTQFSQGKFERAVETTRDQRETATAINARELESDAFRRLGRIAKEQSAYDRARSYHQEALDIAAEMGDRAREAINLKGIGMAAWRQGEYETAQNNFERSLSIAQERGDRQLEAANLSNLGIVFQYRSEYELAREYYERSIAISREISDRHRESKNLNNLGIISEKLGEYEKARTHYERSLEIKHEIGHQQGEARILNNLGEIFRHQGRYERARDHYERSLALRKKTGDRQGETICLTNLGEVTRENGSYEQARDHYETALAIAREIDSPRLQAHNRLGLGAVETRTDNYESARRSLERARKQFETLEDQSGVAKTWLETGRLSLEAGDLADAREGTRRAQETFDQLSEQYEYGQCEVLQGRIALAEGDPGRARTYWANAVETFESLGTTRDSLATLETLVENCRDCKMSDEAQEWCKRAQELLQEAPESIADDYRIQIDRHAKALDL